MIAIMSLQFKTLAIALERIIIKSFLPYFKFLILYSARTGHDITYINVGFITSVFNFGGLYLTSRFFFSLPHYAFFGSQSTALKPPN